MSDFLRPSFRVAFLLGFAACAALMAYALYSQYVLHLEPCPLCIFQRIAMIGLGLVFLAGGLAGPKSLLGRGFWAVLATLVAIAGATISARHMWIQSLPPDKVPACGAPLKDMLQMVKYGGTTYGKVIVKVFEGSGECAKINWTFLGLTMPAWVLICFAALAAWALLAGFRRRA